MIKWNRFVEWLFLGLISFFAWQLNANITKLQDAISLLNTQVTKIITENSVSKDMILDHEARIRDLEKGKK